MKPILILSILSLFTLVYADDDLGHVTVRAGSGGLGGWTASGFAKNPSNDDNSGASLVGGDEGGGSAGGNGGGKGIKASRAPSSIMAEDINTEEEIFKSASSCIKTLNPNRSFNKNNIKEVITSEFEARFSNKLPKTSSYPECVLYVQDTDNKILIKKYFPSLMKNKTEDADSRIPSSISK